MGNGFALKLPKRSILFLKVIMRNFNSSVITAISEVQNNQVTIEFNGTPYTYQVSDVEAWNNDLDNVIEEGESVGRFVNQALRANVLQLI